MQTKLTKGTKANYEIKIEASKDHIDHAEQAALKVFQKEVEIPGFRKGTVPLDIVKEKVQPQYLMMAVYENIINDGIKQVLQDHPELKFIGEPYDINPDIKDDKAIFTLKLDIYPEVETKNNKWEKITIPTIDSKPTQQEIDNAVVQLKKNYADYQDTTEIAAETVSKVKLEYKDKEGTVLHSANTFVGEPEFQESDFWSKTFLGKKKDEPFDITYKASNLPNQIHYTKEEGKPTTITATVTDIKKIVLPNFDEELLKKLFGPDSEVKNEKDLIAFIEKTLTEQKEEAELIKAVENFVQEVKKESMNVTMPHTMIEHEFKSREENLHQRFGGSKEKMKQFLDSMGEEKQKAFFNDIRKSAEESLEKFFILKHICDTLQLDINRDQPAKLEIEKKLYEKTRK